MLRAVVKPRLRIDSSLVRADRRADRPLQVRPRRRRSHHHRVCARGHTSSPHAGPAMRHESMTQRSPSIRARARTRGSQRLCSLNPDTSAAVPPPWRSWTRPCTNRTRSARETRRRDATRL